MLIDTHCHIHEADYPIKTDDVLYKAKQAGVEKIICVGTNLESSRRAVELANKYDSIFAVIGVHPHYAEDGIDDFEEYLSQLEINDKIIAIGEIGLDYYYNNSPREKQIKIFKAQIDLAIKYKLPISFHVRDAFDDFWAVLDDFKSQKIRGVLHCFTDTDENAQKAIDRGFYIGVTGISTFTKDEAQKVMFNNLPMDKVLLETDAPYLTPDPLRGKIKVNEPAYIREIAEHISSVRNLDFREVESQTTKNTRSLFGI